MKSVLAAVAIAAFLAAAASATADQKVNEAVAKFKDQLQKGKREEAEKTVQKLASNPSSEAQLAAGRLQERLGKLDDAAAAYAKAADTGVGPSKAEALAAQAQLELRTGPAKAAVGRAEQAVAAQSSPGTLGALAKAQARVDPTKALQTADQAVAGGASSGQAHDARGVALLAQGRGADAAAEFRKAIELEPTHTRARVGLAASLIAQNKGAEAVAEARKATTEDSEMAEAHSVLAQAMLVENPKAWNDAIAEAQDAAFKNPKNPEIQMVVGKIFEADNRFDQAADNYKKALASDPEFAPARAALIKAQFRKGDLDGATAEAVKLANASPGSGDAQLQAGELLLRKQDFANAIGPLEKAVRLLPGSPTANYYLGRAYQFSGRVQDALAPYKKAAELDAANLDYRSTYGLLLGVNGQPDAGAAELKKVVATPGYKETAGFTNLGWLYRNMQPPKAPESVAAYKKALELDPKNAQAALGLGWAYSVAKNWDECIASYKKAMELDSKLAGESLKGAAWAYAQKRDFAKAREMLNQSEKAGGGDTRLDAILDRVEKAPTPDPAAMEQLERAQEKTREDQAKLDRLNAALQSPNPATRANAVKSAVSQLGEGAFPTLLYMLVNDKDYEVRMAVATGLGSLGQAARKACLQLKAIINASVVADPFATGDALKQQMLEGDFKKACRDALLKIGC
jgi:tetratricopeptide (TPR) repeat protein